MSNGFLWFLDTIKIVNLNFKYLFGVLAFLGIVVTIPAFAQQTDEVTIIKGAGSSPNCSSAKNCFDPSILNISTGTTVEWKNTDSVSHTVTSGKSTDNQTGTLFDSSLLAPGKSFSFTFENTGTYYYFCQVHPWMTGEIIVAVSSATGNTSSTTVPEFGLFAQVVLTMAIVGIIAFSARKTIIQKL